MQGNEKNIIPKDVSQIVIKLGWRNDDAMMELIVLLTMASQKDVKLSNETRIDNS